MNPQNQSQCDSLLSLNEARSRVGLGRSKLYELMAAGDFPRPIKIGSKNLFSANELQVWINDRLSRRQSSGGRDDE